MITIRLYDGYPTTSPQHASVVRELQAALNAAGHTVQVDGFFGPATMAAVEAFQAKKGILVDGIATPATWAALGIGRPSDVAAFDTSYSRDHFAEHLEAASRYRSAIEAAAKYTGYSTALIFAMGSRESGWGLILRPPGPAGTGDFTPRKGGLPPDGGGYGRGLMQIDYKYHEFARTGPWRDGVKNIEYAAAEIMKNIRWQRSKWLALTKTQALRASIAAYNCGQGNVGRALSTGRDIDYFTAHRDYSADVLNRAGWFQRFGWT